MKPLSVPPFAEGAVHDTSSDWCLTVSVGADAGVAGRPAVSVAEGDHRPSAFAFPARTWTRYDAPFTRLLMVAVSAVLFVVSGRCSHVEATDDL